MTIRHRSQRGPAGDVCIHLVPVLDIPIIVPPGHKPRICPTCLVHHPVKTVHLWLDDTGACTVSVGTLELLRRAGVMGAQFDYVAEVAKPPPIELTKPRMLVDKNNRAIRPLTAAKPAGKVKP